MEKNAKQIATEATGHSRPSFPSWVKFLPNLAETITFYFCLTQKRSFSIKSNMKELSIIISISDNAMGVLDPSSKPWPTMLSSENGKPDGSTAECVEGAICGKNEKDDDKKECRNNKKDKKDCYDKTCFWEEEDLKPFN